MERASRLFKDKKISRELLSDEDVVRGAWAIAVGKIIAAHTGRLRLVRNKLLVEVEDAVWQRQLHSLSGQILRRLGQVIGPSEITELEFRIVVQRRQAVRSELREAVAATPGPAPGPLFRAAYAQAADTDEAERIADPILRRVYRNSRRSAEQVELLRSKKATA